MTTESIESKIYNVKELRRLLCVVWIPIMLVLSELIIWIVCYFTNLYSIQEGTHITNTGGLMFVIFLAHIAFEIITLLYCGLSLFFYRLQQ
jgi:hypothetical protein